MSPRLAPSTGCVCRRQVCRLCGYVNRACLSGPFACAGPGVAIGVRIDGPVGCGSEVGVQGVSYMLSFMPCVGGVSSVLCVYKTPVCSLCLCAGWGCAGGTP